MKPPAHDRHAIPLDPRLTITAKRQAFRHVESRAATARPSAGQQGRLRHGTGFTLAITNNENELRSYYFSVGIFADRAEKQLRQTIPRHIAHIRPGQTAQVDIELAHGDDFANAYLVDFVVSHGDAALARYTPDYPLALAAEPDGGGRSHKTSLTVELFHLLVWLEIFLVALGVGLLLADHYRLGALQSWGGGFIFFAAALYGAGRPYARMAVCTLLSLIWGLVVYHAFGLLEAMGAACLAWLTHWWLCSPARAAQRKSREKGYPLA